MCFSFILPGDSIHEFSGLCLRPPLLWSACAVGGPHDRGPFPISVSTSAHCASFPHPPKSSDHGERQHFLFPKSLSPKKERKLLSAGFIWKKRGFRDQQGKKTQKTFYCNEHIKREVFFFIFPLLSVETELIKVLK